MVYERVTESAYIIFCIEHRHFTFCGQNLPAVKPLVRLKITFLCMGAYAATYHADKDCPALKQCQGKVKIYSLESAKRWDENLAFFVLIPLRSKNF